MNPEENPPNQFGQTNSQTPPQPMQPPAQPGYGQPPQPQQPVNYSAPQAYQPPQPQPGQVPQPVPMEQPAQAYGPQPGVGPAVQKSGPNKKLIIAIVAVPLVLGLIAVIVVALTGGSSNNAANETGRTDADTIRAADAVTLATALLQYQTDTGKNLTVNPQEVSKFSKDYLTTKFADPVSGEAYQLVTDEPKIGAFQYKPSARCDDDNNFAEAGAAFFAVRTRLDDNSFYCLDRTDLPQ